MVLVIRLYFSLIIRRVILHMAKMLYSFRAWTSNLVASKLECMMGGLYETALQSPSPWFTPLITLIHRRVSRPHLWNTVSGSQASWKMCEGMQVWQWCMLQQVHSRTATWLCQTEVSHSGNNWSSRPFVSVLAKVPLWIELHWVLLGYGQEIPLW